MMVKVYLYCDTRQDRRGMFPVYVICKGRTGMFRVSTGVFVKYRFSNGKLNRHEPNMTAKTSALRNMLLAAEEECLMSAGKDFPSLRHAVRSRILGAEETGFSLVDGLERMAKTAKALNTRFTYMQTADKVRQYDKDVTVGSIDSAWLGGFETFLLGSLRRNTATLHLSKVMGVMNKALADGKASADFKKFKLHKEETRKRSLSLSQIRDVMTRVLDGAQRDARDLFMLSFLLIGMNPADLWKLRLSDIKAGRVEYKRSKTGTLYSVKVEEEAMELISHLSHGGYAIGRLHKHGTPEKMEGAVRNTLKRVFKDVCPDLTLYWARHTWATIAAGLDVPMDTVSAALGHKNGLAVTHVYVAFSRKKVDEANRLVIDYVKGAGT